MNDSVYDDDGDDDHGWAMVRDFQVVASGYRETTTRKLIVIYVAEIQNWGRC